MRKLFARNSVLRRNAKGFGWVLVATLAAVSTAALPAGSTVSMSDEVDEIALNEVSSTTTVPLDQELRVAAVGEPANYQADPVSPPTTTMPLDSERKSPAGQPSSEVTVFRPLWDGEGSTSGAVLETYDLATGEFLRSEAPAQGGTESASGVTVHSDHVFPNDDIVADGVYAVDLDTYIYEQGCSDPDTCSNGTRKNSGYVWFDALQVTLANSHNGCDYGMHAGLGMGNGIDNEWFFDWSGYYCPAGGSLGTGKGHSISLNDGRWYRIRIWRLTETYPGIYTWGAWVLDRSTGVEKYAGSWALGAEYVAQAIYWMELGEVDPCETDILGIHWNNPTWWIGPYPRSFSKAYNNYEAATCTTSEPPHRQTNVFNPFGSNSTIDYVINDRDTERTWAQGSRVWK